MKNDKIIMVFCIVNCAVWTFALIYDFLRDIKRRRNTKEYLKRCEEINKRIEERKRGREEGWRLAAMIIDIWFNKIHCDANRFNNYFKLNGKLNDDVFKLFFEQYTAEEAAEVLKKEGVI